MSGNRIFVTIVGLVLILFFTTSTNAAVIFSGNYDCSSEFNNWNCSMNIPSCTLVTGKAACSLDTVGGITHYCGEVSPGGRTGNSLKLWRHNDGQTDYCGYLNKALTEQEFNQGYKQLFFRYYMKIPSEWDATLGPAQTHKMNRFLTKTTYGGDVTSTFYFDVKGTSFKSGKFSFYFTKEGPVRYTSKTLTELGIVDGRWHCYEIHFKMNSASGVADGELHFYIDGKEMEIVTPYGPTYPTGLSKWDFKYSTNEYIATLLTPAIGNLTDGKWNFPTNGWYAIEFDDYVVSTTYVGPGGGDTTPPKIPEGVKTWQ